MFAYCGNNPVNKKDTGGKDAIWIQEADSAAGEGHSGLMAQDENENGDISIGDQKRSLLMAQ